MQSKNKNARLQLPERYIAYVLSKRHFGNECTRKVFPLRGYDEKATGVREQQPVTNTITARYEGGQATGSYIVEGKFDAQKSRIRRLTPRECERLQGFPDDWTRYAYTGKEMSDSARYKACGNAVTVNVIEAIIRRLI